MIFQTHLQIVIGTGSVDCRFQIEGGKVDDITVPWFQCREAQRTVVVVSKAVRAVRACRIAVGEVGRLQSSLAVVNGPLTHCRQHRHKTSVCTQCNHLPLVAEAVNPKMTLADALHHPCILSKESQFQLSINCT